MATIANMAIACLIFLGCIVISSVWLTRVIHEDLRIASPVGPV